MKKKEVTAPRIAAALSALLAGAALYTVSGSERQGIQVKKSIQRPQRRRTQYNHGLHERKRPGGGDYGAATADLREMMDAP